VEKLAAKLRQPAWCQLWGWVFCVFEEKESIWYVSRRGQLDPRARECAAQPQLPCLKSWIPLTAKRAVGGDGVWPNHDIIGLALQTDW